MHSKITFFYVPYSLRSGGSERNKIVSFNHCFPYSANVTNNLDVFTFTEETVNGELHFMCSKYAHYSEEEIIF